MNLEVLKRHSVTASAAIALALSCCGSDTSATDTGAPPTTPSTGAAGSGVATTTTPPSATTAGATTTAPTPTTGTVASPAATGAATTPPAVTPTQPVTTPGMTPTGTTPPAMGAMMPAASEPVELPVETGKPTLFWLDITGNTIYTAGADGTAQKVFASGPPMSAPDGVTVDPKGGFVYVLNMGSVLGGAGNGSLVRYKLDGSSPETIMQPGAMGFNTGKQVSIDKVNSKLYLGDREGSKVWRCDLDGKNLEQLVSGHMIQQVVGVAPDPIKKQFYFSDRNGKKLFRANMEMPAGKTADNRDDLELLYVDKAINAMPLDIELDVKNRMIYWTDRQQNTVFGMSMDMPMGMDASSRTDVKKVATGLGDVIGLGFDHENGQLYATHMASVSTFKIDGSGLKQIGTGGTGTGIHFTHLP